ncbi:MAG: hypothetical protein KDB66_07815 [Solirubrobacterales bacterium]|nr:hypothetical protein [Solirubrobacterales bacterium]
MSETPENQENEQNDASKEAASEATTEVAGTREIPAGAGAPEHEADEGTPGTTAGDRTGVMAATGRFANNPVGRWVAIGAAVAVAFFSGLLIGRTTQDEKSEADLASFGRPDGGGPPMGGQAPFQGGQGPGGEQYGHEDGDGFGPPQSDGENGSDEDGSLPQGDDQDDSSGGSAPAPLESGQS